MVFVKNTIKKKLFVLVTYFLLFVHCNLLLVNVQRKWSEEETLLKL
jgi:hypothetical protein